MPEITAVKLELNGTALDANAGTVEDMVDVEGAVVVDGAVVVVGTVDVGGAVVVVGIVVVGGADVVVVVLVFPGLRLRPGGSLSPFSSDQV